MDKLNSFSDDVLCHILSFVPTKRSVQTSVLSKRWRFLWTHVPSLEFDWDDYTLNSNMITEMVLQHEHDINTFHLYMEESYSFIEKEAFESWIVSITKRNIHSIALTHVYHLEWPQCLFTCKTLTDLCIYHCGLIPTSGIYFPNLKKLHLHFVHYKCNKFLVLDQLIFGCPMLEELSIEGQMLGNYCVSSPTLTRLLLGLKNTEILESRIKLDTPALRYLQLYSSMPGEFLVGSLDSLIEADIHLWKEEDQDNLIYSRYVLELVDKLCNVKLLSLSTDRISVVHGSAFFASAIKFHNLTKLDLTLSSNWVFITSFLENADNLRILYLRIWRKISIDDSQHHWMEPKQVPACMISHLQTVVVCYFEYPKEHEFGMMRYILKNANVLKRMEIRTELAELDLDKRSEAIERISLFERGSQESQLVFD